MEIEIRKAIAMSDVIQTINIDHNAYKNSKQKWLFFAYKRGHQKRENDYISKQLKDLQTM